MEMSGISPENGQVQCGGKHCIIWCTFRPLLFSVFAVDVFIYRPTACLLGGHFLYPFSTSRSSLFYRFLVHTFTLSSTVFFSIASCRFFFTLPPFFFPITSLPFLIYLHSICFAPVLLTRSFKPPTLQFTLLLVSTLAYTRTHVRGYPYAFLL